MKTDLIDKTVLIVEDDNISKELLYTILTNIGVKILIATDGQIAVSICKENEVDLIFMDIKLPILDGINALKEIRKFKPSLPIIAQTAFAMVGDEKKYIDEGFNAYISKPFHQEQIVELLNKYL